MPIISRMMSSNFFRNQLIKTFFRSNFLFSKQIESKITVLNDRNISLCRQNFAETIVKMPALSPTMSSGIIIKWHKKEGDKINAGDILCEVQTDKAVVAFEFDDDAILAKILVTENSSDIMVGDLIAIVCEETDDWKNVKIPTDLKKIETSPPILEQKYFVANNMKISPSARHLIKSYKIEASSIKPTGPHGILIKDDVLNFVRNNHLKSSNDLSSLEETEFHRSKSDISPVQSKGNENFIDIEITNMRRTIAKRLTESKSSIPHAYMSIKCRMDKLLNLRKNLKQKSLSISLNDMMVKAVALALKQCPQMNCRWNESSHQIEFTKSVDISIAVATPTGLITPIIKNANQLTLEEISIQSKKLIEKAKDNKLQPEDFLGGTFSISNLGMFDIDHFVGVINPPQAAILAIGSTRPKFFGDPEDYHLGHQTILSLSYDCRAIDEETSADFLEKIQNNIEEPEILLHSDGSKNRRLSAFI
ncbi:ribosomal protein S20 [Sarcoptes scabiei]|nr:ribosomal protein S20 [Sarcoptes scabiei]